MGGRTPAHKRFQACEDPGHSLPQVSWCPSRASLIRASTWPGALRPGLLGTPPTKGFHDSTREAGCRSRAQFYPQRALCPGKEKTQGRTHRGHVTNTARGAHGRRRRDGGY